MQIKRIPHRITFSIFVLALITRAGYVLAQNYFGIVGSNFVSQDSNLYIEIAKNILSGNGIATQNGATAYVSPGFPVFLAGCFAVFGTNTIWTSILQCVLSALVCVFIASTAALLFGKRVGIISGIIAAVYYELILWTSGQILTEPLYTFFLAAAVYAFISAVFSEKSVSLKFSLAGVLFGLAALVRPISLFAALGLGLTIIFVAILFQRERLKPGLLFLGFCLLIMQPWSLRNYFVFDHYLLTSSESGFVFWNGNNPDYDLYENPDFTQFGGYTPMFKPTSELKQKLAGKTEIEESQLYSDEAKHHILNYPSAFLVRAAYKMWNMWRPTFSFSSTRNILISFVFYLPLIFLSLSGIWLAWRQKEHTISSFKSFLLNLTKPVGLLCIFLLVYLLLHSIVNGEIRFRVPLWIVLIPFAGLAVSTIFQRERKMAI